MVTGDRLAELAGLYAAFAKVEDPLPPAVAIAEREFSRLLKQSYEELTPTLKAGISFDSFRYQVMPDIMRAAFDNVRKFPTILPEIPRK